MKLFDQLVRMAAIALVACSALAQDDASKPVRVILPFGPGSGTDSIARSLLDEMSRELKQTFVVENRAGASGFIAAEAVARAAPDGKTLLYTASTTHTVNPVLFKKLPYDPVKDFRPIGMVMTAPYFLAVGKDVPARTVPELVAWLKANPTKASYGWGAAVSQMAGASFLQRYGIQAVGVPYKSSPQALTEFLGGQFSFMFLDLVVAMPIINSDRVKLLAVTAPRRISQAPGIPTMAEVGVPNFEVAAWSGMFAPAGTPEPVVQRYMAAVRKVMTHPSLLKKFENCCTPAVLVGDDFAEFMRKDRAQWTERAAAAGIVPE